MDSSCNCPVVRKISAETAQIGFVGTQAFGPRRFNPAGRSQNRKLSTRGAAAPLFESLSAAEKIGCQGVQPKYTFPMQIRLGTRLSIWKKLVFAEHLNTLSYRRLFFAICRREQLPVRHALDAMYLNAIGMALSQSGKIGSASSIEV